MIGGGKRGISPGPGLMTFFLSREKKSFKGFVIFYIFLGPDFSLDDPASKLRWFAIRIKVMWVLSG